MRFAKPLAIFCAFFCSIPTWSATAPTVVLNVDATHAPRKIFHASLQIPATSGDLTLYYPKWIPGEHAPDGPVDDLAGLFFKANGQTLKWRRDLLDGFTIHVEVPAGVNQVNAELDFLSPATLESGFSAGSSATDKLALISWNQVLLYPKGWKADEINYTASLKIPEGWKFGTPLPIANQNGNEIRFATASLTTLVDSPVITGEFLKVVSLAQDPLTEMASRPTVPRRSMPLPRYGITTKAWWIKRTNSSAPIIIATTTSSIPSAITSLTSALSITSPTTAASMNAPSSMTHPANSPLPFYLMNTCIAGMESIAAPTTSRLPTTSSPCKMISSGSMKASRTISGSC